MVVDGESNAAPPAQTVKGMVTYLRSEYPAFKEFRPLRIGIHKDLRALNLAPWKVVRNALVKHIANPRYIRSLAMGGARYCLDGQPWGVIAPKHVARAKRQIKNQTMEVLDMQANTLKVTAVITDFGRHLTVKTAGATSVPVIVEVGGKKVSAHLNPKSFRKAQTAFRELNGEAAVVLSGEYDIADETIRSAGIAVMPKKAKEGN